MWGKSEWRGPLVISLVEQASKQAAQDAAEETLRLANEHVPYDLGNLEASGGTDIEQMRASVGQSDGGQYQSGWDASVYYDEVYAVWLHEHPEFEFQGQGEGKWLEKAVMRQESSWPDQLAPPLVEVFKLP